MKHRKSYLPEPAFTRLDTEAGEHERSLIPPKASFTDPPRVLLLWCSDWPVVAAGIRPEEPGAVMHANRVVASSEAARSVGVVRGLRRREAQGRCPELTISERDLATEARLFEEVVAAVEAFTPRIEITQPGTCLFPTIGPSRYFGGDLPLAEKIQQAVTDTLAGRTTCSIGIADGVFAGRIAARTSSPVPHIVPVGESPGFLAPLPITLLDMPDLTDVLWRLGVRTLGEFAAFERTDVIGRFSRPGLVAHARASGFDESLPDATDPPEDMTATLSLDPPVERIDQAAFAARQLALTLHGRLEARGAACSRVTIEAETEHGERLARGWRHEGALSVGALTDRVRWQLDGWLNASPAVRPSGGLNLLVLRPDDLLPAKGRQLGFWGGETEADLRAGRAVARLEALVGSENVQVAEWRGGREPDDAIGLLPAGSVDLAERKVQPIDERPWPGQMPAPSPVELFSEQPVEVLDSSGQSVVVSGRGEVSGEPATISRDGRRWKQIVAWAGPWLLDERWWDPDRTRRRARFQLVDEDGEAMLAHVERGGWWLAGTY
ncbi:MAG: DNA polymerase Y family protein [Acidimicrobiales bacterium]